MASRYAPHVTAAAVAILLVVFGTLSYRAILTKSASYDETMHAVAGQVIRQDEDYRLDIEAPALFLRWGALAHGREDLHERLRQLVRPVVFQREAEEAAVDPLETGLLVLLAAEGLDDLRAGEGLLEERVQGRDLLLGPSVDRVQAPPHGPDGQAH